MSTHCNRYPKCGCPKEMGTKCGTFTPNPKQGAEIRGNDYYENGVYQGSIAFKKIRSIHIFCPDGSMRQIRFENANNIKTINL